MATIDQTLTSGNTPGPDNPNGDRGPAPYACWVYRKTDGAALLVHSEEERDKCYKGGYVDSPAKVGAPAKKAAKKVAAKKAARK